jgi:acyl carrier protein
MNEAAVRAIIFRALEALNRELPETERVPVGPDTKLLGESAALDSLSLVSVILDVEAGIESEFGRSLSLTDDRAMSQPVSPFGDVKSLSAYALLLLSEGS